MATRRITTVRLLFRLILSSLKLFIKRYVSLLFGIPLKLPDVAFCLRAVVFRVAEDCAGGRLLPTMSEGLLPAVFAEGFFWFGVCLSPRWNTRVLSQLLRLLL